ncbi:hypothetical protein DFJ67_4834 [Asanoa ferruginea]|uniref:Dolichyl-phosphate-mannose-protein mannosyltransferase n=1 Tax=Asanoa ferruginea TaxID=53367 RepID=A0A3D9ZQ99_9ACTN|nr:hypothetical protein [Asanoa ferruginea]REF98814.1 hypothetical protein DFJ67_4834 [Asanoa ferruginea]GIF49557.1 hypothetical protein Afe04nite_40960 [Asanoa ferruginea]
MTAATQDRFGRVRLRLLEALAPLALVAATLAIHDVPAALRPPYWLDEAWVAASVRFPISDLPVVTSSTPLGWTALLRLVPGFDRLRLLPIAFLVLSVLAGYALAAVVRWPSRAHRIGAGLVTGLAVALLPAQQVRHDLKQYTADAAVALLLLVVAGLVEAGGYPRQRLALLLATASAGMLVSHTTVLVGGCVVGGLLVAALARGLRRQAVEVAVTGALMLAVFVAGYAGLDRRGNNGAMDSYWQDFFPSVGHLPGFLGDRLTDLRPYLGVPWPVLLLLAAAGVVTVARLGRPALACGAAFLLPAAVLAGLAHQYPLLDLRTSHFLLVCLTAFATLGVAGLATAAGGLLARRSRAGGAVVAAVLAAAVLGGYVWATADWLRFGGTDPALGTRSPALTEDVRDPAAYVWAHRHPGDVVLVSGSAAFGFADYWPERPGHRPDPATAVGWQPTYADPAIVVSPGRDPAAIHAGLLEATGLAAKSGPGAVVWLIRSHQSGEEKVAWKAELATLTARSTPSGPEPAVRIEAW